MRYHYLIFETICYKEHKCDYFIKWNIMSEKDKATTEKNKEQKGETSGEVFSME